MAYYGVKPTFGIDGFYHLYNRGVAKQAIFLTQEDYERFLLTLAYYIESVPEQRLSFTTPTLRKTIESNVVNNPLVDILAYCLMPNHFHLIVRQRAENGVSTFMRRSLNSYTRAFNARYHRVGPVFQGVYQAVGVESDEQFLHVSRYVHLNPYVAKLTDDPADYRWSSYPQILEDRESRLCQTSFLFGMVGSAIRYRSFVEDYASYARDLAVHKAVLIDLAD